MAPRPSRRREAMPGVTPVASGVPYFFVRGAPPGNVGYFVDGVRVPLLLGARVESCPRRSPSG